MTQPRDPRVGDQVIIVRCDNCPALIGECATVEAMPGDDGLYRVRNGGNVDGFVARADFIVRTK